MMIDSNNLTKDIIFHFDLYKKEQIEDELYLMQNQNALNQTSYDKFLELETVVEDLDEEVFR
ncbi:MAG: hypothetical protein PHF17_06035 [Arcobacteraceae bacterium]|nr:hypothetical protein [Arcobacteraceae bacterium]